MATHNFPEPPFPAQPQEWPGSNEAMEPHPHSATELYKPADKLAGKVALITGADSGIGRAVAATYAKEGADVVVSYLSEDADAQETKKLVEAEGRKCLLIAGDIQSQEHCKRLVTQTMDTFGQLDILVNNAAYQMTSDDIEKFDMEELDKTFHTNVYALIFLVQAALPHLKQKSSIINTTSIQAYQPSPTLLPYAATKAAIVNISKSLAQAVVARGIRVNAVAPGPVWTPLIPTSMPQESVKNFGKQSWFGRPAQPAELAPLYVFLASEEASYVTGQVYGATGEGWP